MNNKMIRYIIGYILKLEAGFLILPLFVSFYFKESMLLHKSYLYTIILLVISGFALSRKIPKNQKIYAKEGHQSLSRLHQFSFMDIFILIWSYAFCFFRIYSFFY